MKRFGEVLWSSLATCAVINWLLCTWPTIYWTAFGLLDSMGISQAAKTNIGEALIQVYDLPLADEAGGAEAAGENIRLRRDVSKVR